ncbi:GTPase subunit of restriction endonuclease-like protein [Carbonactinospora thermoautotrophica]|uniref:GTPase subunit of restriction endonuclease-like protein n=1 Tax=Carbonactinospora thermoautotrophica TaxID=1469144 RepID=A0A132MTC7_9ACTN|nr:AAA family ATPase [Carbonactinospora thermoautotrophica]KWX01079.1 GTPase subunit of restriction endonuclease-like protein [Carbonactinospora thermoautotrophica]
MSTFARQTGARLRAALEILADEPKGLHVRELWQLVRERVPLTEEEERRNPNGRTKGEDRFRWHSVDVVRAGWLVKDNGVWRITGPGRKALFDYPDPADFYRAAYAAYRYWEQNQHRYDRVEHILGALPDGTWVPLPVLAEYTGLREDALADRLQGARPPGWYRVLDESGGISTFAPMDEERDTWFRLLEEDGVRFEAPDRAARSQLLATEDLAALEEPDAPDETPSTRAWLLRAGRRLGEWRDEEYCALPADLLRTLLPGVDRERVRAAVEEDLRHLSYTTRAEKAGEFHDFLTRMRPGDLVAASGLGGVLVGQVTGEPEHVRNDTGQRLFRRAVRWRTTAPVPHDNLPEALVAKLSTQRALLDVTDFVDDLQTLLDGRRPAGTVARPREVELPPATRELAEELLVPKAWLDECVALLRERPQLVFYGPPGTGKTYLAQRLAWHLAGRENTVVVQFHPAYSYEDFFEGYRPSRGADGQVRLDLVAGPFRRLVERSRDEPEHPFVLVIDELNRANLAKVFGELYFLLEYRDHAVNLLYSSGDDPGFTLPRNVLVLATMNTADRSIALVDAAMRRRFSFRRLYPNEEPVRSVFRRWLADRNADDTLARLLDELNDRIGDVDFMIGPSYLMRPTLLRDGQVDREALGRVWEHEILPLLEDHHHGQDVRVREEYALDTLLDAIAG